MQHGEHKKKNLTTQTFGPVFTKHFILPLRVLLNNSIKFLDKSFLLKPIHKAAETNFY